MKVLEILFLILTFLMPSLLIAFIRKNRSRIRTHRKRKRMVKLIIATFFVNLIIFGGIKTYIMLTLNNKKENMSEIKKEDNNKTDEPTIIESETESNSNRTEEDKNKEITKEDKNQDKTDNKNKDDNTSEPVVNNVNKTSKGYTIENKDGVTYVDGYLVVNKTYSLPSTFVPTGTHKKAPSTGICSECINEDAYKAYIKMKNDMSKEGLNIYIASGYRSYSYQGGLYNSYVKRNGQEAADTFSARAGHSEHQSGLAFDLNSVTDAFANTKEGIWVNKNCYKYGFIIRYPKGKDNVTGYKYESWHLRYTGTDLASKLYNSGDWITMEEYFGITSKYAN